MIQKIYDGASEVVVPLPFFSFEVMLMPSIESQEQWLLALVKLIGEKGSQNFSLSL